MTAWLANIVFMNPWVLVGAASLPILWFLLRVMPPAPQRIVLPTARFLAGLVPDTQTPSRTPWWILILRILIAALVLLALAQPVYNPAQGLPGSGPIRLVIDNSWPSAQTWTTQIQAAEESLAQAGREKREIYILTTAPPPGEETPAQLGPLSYGEALPVLRGIKPRPWPASYTGAKKMIEEHAPKAAVTSLWFSHGMDEGGIERLMETLQAQGGLHYIAPAPSNLPLLLRMPEKNAAALQVEIDAPDVIAPGLPASVLALSEDGSVIDRQEIALAPDKLPTTVTFNVPETLRNSISQFRLAGQSGAGGTVLLDNRHRKRSVGIAAPPEKTEGAPLVEAGYYLKRALEPFSTLHLGSVEQILEQKPSVIILPDIASMPPETLESLDTWVKEGGLLLRFAGPNMTQDQNENYLLPVQVRKGRRAIDGSLSWQQEPAKLESFPQTSPLFGLAVPEDVTVRQQILPEPSEDIDEKTWAVLSDGTPLITAAPLEQGMLVFVHTTANTAWSDLALSGVFVEILQRIVSISGSTAAKDMKADGYLEPHLVLDGFGRLEEPGGSVQSIPATDFATVKTSPAHPPGIYGRGGYQQALNTGNHVGRMTATTTFPSGVKSQTYGNDFEIDLMPLLLFAALTLLLIDWLVMLVIGGNMKSIGRFLTIQGRMAAMFFILSLPFPTQAQEQNYADGIYLAYMRTGDAGIDAASHQGLQSLAEVLQRRTSVEPEGVVGLNPEIDELAFFPIIYWPVTENQVALSPKALNNVQNYLDHGGTILFDTRDRNYASSALVGTKNTTSLRNITKGLNLPPLIPIPQDHVLSKSFYLLDSYPGRYTGGTLWVSQDSVNNRDGVSSIIIGSHDWAGAWASPSGSQQQEMAQRFGVNLVIYALTGNYKADQVHVPFILERLGQ